MSIKSVFNNNDSLFRNLQIIKKKNLKSVNVYNNDTSYYKIYVPIQSFMED